MKVTIYILSILLIIIFLIFAELRNIVNKISFDFKIKNVNFATLKISDLLKTGQSKINSAIEVLIKNPTIFPVTINGFNINIYYKSLDFFGNENGIEKIANLTNINKITLKPKSTTSFMVNADIYINPSSILFAVDQENKNIHIELPYDGTINIYGVSSSLNDIYVYQE